MKILVLGGTGAMGTYLVNLLSELGYQVTVTSRSRDDAKANVRYLKGDAHDPQFLTPVLTTTSWTAIIDFMVYSTSVFEARSSLLLDATEQYFFLSSARVYAESCAPLIEDSPRLIDVCTDMNYLATDEYALSKARQENILFSAAQPNWTVIRPYITFSNERLQLGVLEKEDWLFRALNDRTIVFSSDINDRITTLTYGEDVAIGILSLIGQSAALGEAFHITSPTTHRWSDVLNVYLDTLEAQHKARPRVIMANLGSFINSHPGKYQIIYDRLYDRAFSCEKIDRFLDTSQFMDPLQSLRSCLESFLEKPRFKHLNVRFEAQRDRIAHERTPLSQILNWKQKVRYLGARYINS